jgi:hypothetical protein
LEFEDMQRNRLIGPAAFLVAGLFSSILTADVEDDGLVDGMELIEKTRRGEIYADPGVDWTTYDAIILDMATVAFRKNWQRDQNRGDPFKVRTEDMERIKSELSEMFGEVFSKELTEEGGYTITDAAADNVMRLSPQIVDLDVAAPDTRNSATMTRSYTEQAGRMTLKLEIHDSVTGDLIARLSHRQEAPRKGYLQWTTSVSNRADFRRMLERWAKSLRERLDTARETSASAS